MKITERTRIRNHPETDETEKFDLFDKPDALGSAGVIDFREL